MNYLLFKVELASNYIFFFNKYKVIYNLEKLKNVQGKITLFIYLLILVIYLINNHNKRIKKKLRIFEIEFYFI